MAFFVADRVKETTTSTGTGTINLAGAEAGFQSFVAGVGNGNTTYYAIIDTSNETWEVGVGTITDADPDTLSRDTILASSNAGSAVDFAAGEKDVFVTQPSDKAVYKDSDSDGVTIDKIQLISQSSHPSYSEGLLWYDNIHNTLNYYGDESGLVHEIGLEEHQKVYNNSGVTINKGQPMYFSGNFNGYPTVGLANATDVNKYNAQGIAAHSIENNSYGYVCTAGLVEDVDTSGLSAGTNFFVGLTDGAVQNASPTYPNYPMCLGWVVNSDASSGILLVNQQNHSVNSFRVRTDTHIGGDLIIDGDLTVVGSQTIASSTNVETGAPFLYLNSGDSIGQANTTFTGSGLDDAYFAGHFSGTASTTYYVKIDATGTPDTFSWSKDNFSTTEATGVAITGGEQTLDNGIKINFGATTGHTLNDVWSGTATPVDVDTGIWSNRNTGGTGVGYTHVGMFFDVTDSKFKLVDEYDPEPTGVINTGDSSYSAGSLVVDSIEASSASISGNITVTGTVDGRDVGADGSKLDGIEAGATADQTASEILTLIKTVDGSGSGLDADTLDGINSSSFLRSDQSDSTSGTLTVQTLSVGTNNVGTTSDIALTANVAINAENSLSYGLTDASAGYYRWMFGNTSKTSGISGGTEKMRLDKDGNLTLSGTVDGRDIAADGTKLDGIESGATADQTAAEILTAIKTVDGSGSGLDADLIDGVHGPFVKEGGTDFSGQYPMVVRTAANTIYSNAGIQYTGSTDTLDVSGSINIAGNRVLTVADEGSGNGLDADTVDGIQASSFVRSDASDTLTGATYTLNSTTDQKIILQGSSSPYIRFRESTTDKAYIQWNAAGYLQIHNTEDNSRIRVKDDLDFSPDSSNYYSIWHEGNDGSGSGLDADLLDGQQGSYYYPASNPNGYTTNIGDITGVTAGSYLTGGGTSGGVTLNVDATTAATASKVVARDSSGDDNRRYGFAQYFNMSHGTTTRSSDTIFYSSTDSYIRKTDATGMRASLSVPTRTGGDASGTWGINITGSAANADTVDGLQASAFIRGGNVVNSTHLLLNNGQQLRLGDSSSSSGDLRIYADANATTTNYIDSHDGHIFIRANCTSDLGNNIYIQAKAGENSIICNDDTSVQLMYDNVIKLQTDASGVNVTGNLNASSSVITAAVTINSWIYHSGDLDTYIGFPGVDTFRITTGNGTRVTVNNTSFSTTVPITSSGDITAFSDIRLKENVETIDNALDKVKSMRGVTYTKDGKDGLGVIAQEVEKIIPEVVLTADDEIGTKSVAYGNMVGLLIEAVKEQQEQIDALKNEITALKGLD
jgi:hypothetical protein